MAGKVAFVVGVTGQDGAFLADSLLANGHLVLGVKRRRASFNTHGVDHSHSDPRGAPLRISLARRARVESEDPQREGVKAAYAGFLSRGATLRGW